MRLFVYEHLCGGGWPAGDLPGSLATEGGAMLQALCEDFSRLPQTQVTTTLDRRCQLELSGGIHVVTVDSPPLGREERHRQASIADAAIVIAPELENRLARLIRDLRRAGSYVIAPADSWVELCSDKLQLHRFLSLIGIPTIPTFPLQQPEAHALTTPDAVIKPRFGAGSQTISVLPSHQVKELQTPPISAPVDQLIVQPFIPGQAVSVGSVSNELGECTHFPVAEQLLSADGYLQYQGGRVPWRGEQVDALQRLVRRCREKMPELLGYVGFDFVIPEDQPTQPLLVEINPRLCTSYLGYRQLTDTNLASLMLPDGPREDVIWSNQQVEFQPDGQFTTRPLLEAPPCG